MLCVHLFASRGGRRQQKRGDCGLLVIWKLRSGLACSCEGGVPPFLGQATHAVPCSGALELACTRTQKNKTAFLQPIIHILVEVRERHGSSSLRLRRAARAPRPLPKPRRRVVGIVGVCRRRLATAAFPLPQLSKERHRGPSLRGGGRRPAQGFDGVPRFGRRPAGRIFGLSSRLLCGSSRRWRGWRRHRRLERGQRRRRWRRRTGERVVQRAEYVVEPFCMGLGARLTAANPRRRRVWRNVCKELGEPRIAFASLTAPCAAAGVHQRAVTCSPATSLALVVGKCVAPRSQLAVYRHTRSLDARGKRAKRGHVGLPKTHHNNPNDVKMMA